MLDIQELIFSIIFASTGILILFGIGYWFLFKRDEKIPAWKIKVHNKLKELAHKEIDDNYLVMEYDKLFENALQEKYGKQGESLGSLLKKYKKKFTRAELNEIWSAHKLRNKIVHDSDYDPDKAELLHAKITLKKAIQEIVSN